MASLADSAAGSSADDTSAPCSPAATLAAHRALGIPKIFDAIFSHLKPVDPIEQFGPNHGDFGLFP
jgi:hypothetical protein